VLKSCVNYLSVKMRKLHRLTFAVLALFWSVQLSYATGDSLAVLTPMDTIFIQNDSLGGNFFYHKVAPKQTMYAICKFYGLKPAQLQELNPALKVRTIQVDELIRVPISAKLIRVSEPPGNRNAFAPVYYEVKPGEGLYRISKNYFSIKPEKLMQINSMAGPDLRLGQLLLLGWIPLDVFNKKEDIATASAKNSSKTVSVTASDPKAAPASAKASPVKPAVSTDKEKAIAKAAVTEAVAKVEKEEATNNTPASNKDRFENAAGRKISDQGMAFWHKELKGSKGLYVLHRSAPQGSVIKLINPMFNTTVYAKVAGTIPSSNYPDEIMVIVSPEVASKLGAKDARFFAKIMYIK